MSLVPSLQAGSEFGKFCFSHDSKFLFCCYGSSVKVFNTSNGECLHELHSHTKAATGVALNPGNVLQIVSCGQDGMLVFWDYLDGVKLKQHNLHMPLYGILFIHPEKKSITMLAQPCEHKQTFSLMQWKKSKTDTNDYAQPKLLIEKCSNDLSLVSLGCQKKYIAAGLRKELAVYSIKKGTSKFMNNSTPITCVACHPTEYKIATGLKNGKILIWHNFFQDGQATTSTLHWHSLAVLCFCFSPDGTILLSGGHECVLVRWQMNNPNQRDYKPRMGAPLTNVLMSPDGNMYATKHANNVIQLVDINLKVLQVYQGLSRNQTWNTKSPIPCGLHFDPRSKTLVTNGLPGHLQFYSLTLNKQLYNLDIVGQNYISPENLDRPKAITEILSIAISEDGQWLATFEMWDDHVFTPELRLKFWQYTTQAQTYSLNTTVEWPHEEKITSMLFRPGVTSQESSHPPTLVTLADDSCFKLWTLIDDTDIYRSNTRWNYESVGYLRGLRACYADFSEDSSTLGVAFEHLVTIWDPDNNVVRTTLSNSLPSREQIVGLKFGRQTCCQQLVVSTVHTLLVWDLTSLSIQWKIKADITHLIKDPCSDLMAFVTVNRSVNVFRPSSADMIYTSESISNTAVEDAIFVPGARHQSLVDVGWPGDSQLFFYTADQHLITLDLPNRQLETAKVSINQNVPASTLSTILAEKTLREGDKTDGKNTSGRSTKVDEEFISMLLRSNEPVSMHCDKYLSNLVLKRKPSQSNPLHKSTVGDTQSDSSDSESEVENKEEFSSSNTKPASYSLTSSRGSKTTLGSHEEDMDKLLSKPLDWLKWFSKSHQKPLK